MVETRVLATHFKINIGNLKNGSLYWEVQDQSTLLTSQDLHDSTFPFLTRSGQHWELIALSPLG